MTNAYGMTKVKTPVIRRVPSTTGSEPVPGAVLTSVMVSFHLSDRGYLVACSVQWCDPSSRPGLAVKDVVKHYRITRWQGYPVRPGLRHLLRSASHALWDLASRDVTARLEGEEPLPGL
jgi:hypothetical protein